MGSREGFRDRRRRKKAARDRLAEKTEMVRAETKAREAERARAEEREKEAAKERARAQARTESDAAKRERSERKRSKAERKARKKSGAKAPKRKREGIRALRKRRRGRRRSRKGMSRSERIALHRAQVEELWVWTKGVGLETRRRAKLAWRDGRRRAQPVTRRIGEWLAPVGRAVMAVLRLIGRGVRAVLAPIAPYVAAGLFLVLRALGALVRGLLDVTLAVLGWIRDRAVALGRWADRNVTAPRVFAVLAAAGAVALAVSQFIDYRATAIGGEQYSGEVGTIADVPRIDQKPAGDPHAYVLLPLAVLALPLIWFALRGRRRLALIVAAIGAVGVIVTLAIDLPKGLDTGVAGEAYEGTEAHLIEGFWTQLIASLVLLASGLALASFARTSEGRGRDRRRVTAGTPATPGPGPAGSGAGA